MKLSVIPFNHFFTEVCEHISKEHIALLQPYRQVYCKLGHIYVALGYNNNAMMVEYVVNTGKKGEGDWKETLYNSAKGQGNAKIIFATATQSIKDFALSHGGREVPADPLYHLAEDKSYTSYEIDLK